RDDGAGELLRDRARAGDDVPLAGGLKEGPDHGDRVDSDVREEARVLGGEQRRHDGAGQLVERNPGRELAVLRPDFAQEPAAAIADLEARSPGGRDERRGQGRERRHERERRDRHEQRRADPGERHPETTTSRHWTTTVSAAVRPNVSGVYISSAFVGGSTNLP